MNQLKYKVGGWVFLAFIVFALTLSVSSARASNPLQVTPQPPSPTPGRIDGFEFCAVEGGTCMVYASPGSVRYGSGTSFIFKIVSSGSIPCTAAAFGGDPAPGTVKECRYTSVPNTSYVSWIACATEGGVCAGYGGNPTVKLARYGAGNNYVYKTTDYVQNNSIACTTQAFGSDPAPGLPKQCLFIELPNNSTAWVKCADVGGTCNIFSTPVRTFAYGRLPSAFYYRSFGGGASVGCNNTTFSGNPYPYPGTNSCYVAPIDYDTAGWVRCANNGGTCTFLGTKTVAYGTSALFYYKTATGSIPCTGAAFGDPAPTASNRCYYKQ